MLWGDSGTRSTLHAMRQMVRDGRTDPQIRDLAERLVSSCPGKAWACEVARLHSFVRDRIRYVRDPRGLEVVQAPGQTLLVGSGDCDDQVVLLGSLLESIGHPVRFVAMGFTASGAFVHVFLETRLGAGWVAAETTERWPLGQRPPQIGRTMIVKV